MSLGLPSLHSPLDWVRHGPSWVASLWNHPFQDARLILEQNTDLRYLVVTAKVQRIATRSIISAVFILFFSLVFLAVSAIYLKTTKVQLEQSHRQIYAALLTSTSDLSIGGSLDLSADDMLTLAQAIRERDTEIRRIVSTVTGDLYLENDSLDDHLTRSGLTESAVDIIQNSSAIGGFGRDLDTVSDPLLKGSFSEQSARNRDLKDVLMALPVRYPVADYYVSSRFGMRSHPLSGRPRFHAGIDLVTRSDDRVYPSKEGKVVLARDYHTYGKTIILRHERGIETLYAHLDEIFVQEGQEVDFDTVIGLVGNTGASTGKHLHFEVTVGGFPVDPLKVISTAQNVQQAQR
jgi:murein DD-endopeptidase MepM/ murein hydrolase activator NlpD